MRVHFLEYVEQFINFEGVNHKSFQPPSLITRVKIEHSITSEEVSKSNVLNLGIFRLRVVLKSTWW